jgi:molybdopterin-containing oxidoreductase family iron-sulfur binding subunit
MSEYQNPGQVDGLSRGRPFDADGEFGPPPDEAATGFDRRDFLRLAGFALAGTTLAGCQRAPVQYALPYLVQPEGVVPGRSYQYASVCGGCSAGCGMLVTNRDGRPIKLEGNPDHPLSRGGLCATGQASLLGLYDEQRLKQPLHRNERITWDQANRDIRHRLQALREPGARTRSVRFLTGPLVSPALRAQIQRFLSRFAGARHVVLDTRGGSAIAEAHYRTHGARLVPHYRFEQADVIVSFDADFLGTWISPVEFTAAYQVRRRPQDTLPAGAPDMSYHVQFESRLSLTGSKADQRLAVRPGDMGLILSHLAKRLAQHAGQPFAEQLDAAPVPSGFLDQLARTLWDTHEHGRRSLVLCGSDDVEQQVLCNFLNDRLGNYGATVDLSQPSSQAQGNKQELERLLRELHDGQVGALFVYQCNPIHDLPNGETLARELEQVPLFVCCAERLDETARVAQYVCPVSHYLETWSDAEPIKGLISLVQPAITPLGDTRSLLEMLHGWMGGQPQSGYELLRAYWQAEVFSRRLVGGSFDSFWNQTLHQGVAPPPSRLDLPAVSASTVGNAGSFVGPASLLAAASLAPGRADRFDRSNRNAVRLVTRAVAPPEGTYNVVLYVKVGMLDAAHAYNAWLQELPDPITKVAWDNYACLSPQSAAALNVRDGDVIRLEATSAGGQSVRLDLPALVQPGQHDQVVAIALGYGSRLSERFAEIGPPWLEARPTVGANQMVGQNAAPLLSLIGGAQGVRLTKTALHHSLASTQPHANLEWPAQLARADEESRPVAQDTTLTAFRRPPPRRQSLPVVTEQADLWPNDHTAEGTRWGMVIDQNACTGCSACVIACQAENNIPVVGKDEVRRHREMHWIRLDRYYVPRAGGIDVLHQVMLCQHCGQAPCEPVCPVLATVHSTEGLNQQVYNRCVGTRYCANNCPYKVRRFNWFDYAHTDLLQNLVLNPNVTVRSRGVMEKCTFCVQRIQEAKGAAASQRQPLRDGAVQTACQQSCPAHAISFGNLLSEPRSEAARAAGGRRSYHVLEELNTRPAVSYLTLVRNRPVNTEGEGHGQR